MQLYEYEESSTGSRPYDILETAASDGLVKSLLSFPSPFNTKILENDTVYASIFQKQDGASRTHHRSRELVILVHGFGTRGSRLDNYHYFASVMARSGIACLFINLPYHLKRKPHGEKSGQRLAGFDDRQTLDFFHQSVVDIRSLVDISCRVFSPSRIYLCGISMGCMISVLVLAFEDRIKKAALLLGGGNWEEIHWKGVLRFILDGDCSGGSTGGKRAECRKAYETFPYFMERLKKSGRQFISSRGIPPRGLEDAAPKACFLCDPMAFAHMVGAGRVLMINSRFDLYFSRRSVKYLWKELGRPRIVWTNGLHSSRILRNERINGIILDHFRR